MPQTGFSSSTSKKRENTRISQAFFIHVKIKTIAMYQSYHFEVTERLWWSYFMFGEGEGLKCSGERSSKSMLWCYVIAFVFKWRFIAFRTALNLTRRRLMVSTRRQRTTRNCEATCPISNSLPLVKLWRKLVIGSLRIMTWQENNVWRNVCFRRVAFALALIVSIYLIAVFVFL